MHTAVYRVSCLPSGNPTETLKDVWKTRKAKKEKEVRKRREPSEFQGWQQREGSG